MAEYGWDMALVDCYVLLRRRQPRSISVTVTTGFRCLSGGEGIVSLQGLVTIREARRVVGVEQVAKGNLSNGLLWEGSNEEIEKAARACVESGECRGHIFNLDHGLLRETPYENIEFLMKVLRGI